MVCGRRSQNGFLFFFFYRFDYRLQYYNNDSVDLTSAMQSKEENEKRAVGEYVEHFFHELLLRVAEFRDETGTIPQRKTEDIMHLSPSNLGPGFPIRN